MAHHHVWITGFGVLLCCWMHAALAATVPVEGAEGGVTVTATATSAATSRIDHLPEPTKSDRGEKGGKIVCYYSSWSGYRPGHGSYSVDDIPLHLCTHVVYAFIGLNNRTWELLVLDPTNDITKGGYRRFTSLKKKSPSLKTLISVGGWVEGGRKYSEMTSRPERRRVFVNSVVDFLKWFNFDGLDLDWEFPGSADRDGTAEDKQNFVLLVQELREAFDKEGWGWLLTAVAPIMRFRVDSGYDVEKLSANLDHINLLTYDLRGNWTGFTDIHTPLRPRSFDHGDYEGVNMHDGADLWERKGAVTSKLMIGLAMYGRTYTLADPTVNGLRAPLSVRQTAGRPGPYTKANGTLAYYEICELQKEGGWDQKYDPIGDSVYMTKGDQWIGFDDRQSLVEKVKFVQEKGFGGVAVWSLDLDDFRGICGEKRILMNAIYKQMYGKSAHTAGPNFPKTSLITGKPPAHHNVIGSFNDDVTPRNELLDQSEAAPTTSPGVLVFDITTPRSLSIAQAEHQPTAPSTQHHFRSTVPPTAHAVHPAQLHPLVTAGLPSPVVLSATAAPPTSAFFAPPSTTPRALDLNPNLLHEALTTATTEPSPDVSFDGHRITVPDDVFSRGSTPEATTGHWSTEFEGSSDPATFGNVEDHSGTTIRERGHFPSVAEQSTLAPRSSDQPTTDRNELDSELTERNEVDSSTASPTTNAGQLDDLGLAGIFANNDEVPASRADPQAVTEEVQPEVTTPAPTTTTTTTTTTTELPTTPVTTRRSVIVTRPPIRRKPGSRTFARQPKTSTVAPPSDPTNSVTSSGAANETVTTSSVANKIRTKPFRLGGATGNQRPPFRRRRTSTTTSTVATPTANSDSSTVRTSVRRPTSGAPSSNDVTANSDQLQTSASRTAPPVRRFPPGRRLKIKSTTELFTELATGHSTTSRRTPPRSSLSASASATDDTTDWATSESAPLGSATVKHLPNRGSSRFQNPGSLLTSRPQTDDNDHTASPPITLRNRVRVRPNNILSRNRFHFPTTTTTTTTATSDTDASTLQSGSSDYRQIFVRFAPTPAVRLIRNFVIRPRQMARSVPTGGSSANRPQGGADDEPVDPSAPTCPLASSSYAAHPLCDKYWWCVHGKAMLKSCEMGLLWNPETSSCDWAGDIVRNDCE